MVLRVPAESKGEFKLRMIYWLKNLLLDSIKESKSFELAILLPFKANEIEFDSIEKTKRILQNRNLHTISTEFYSGVLLAADTLSKNDISLKLNTFDTENSILKINEIINSFDLSKVDAIIGPLIPSNFDFLSTKTKLMKIPVRSSINKSCLDASLRLSISNFKRYFKKTYV